MTIKGVQTFAITADEHAAMAERATHEANVKLAKRALLLAEADLIRAQAALAKYETENE